MPHVEQKTLATVINTPTHRVTHSAEFESALARHPIKAKFNSEMLRSELLHGAAAQDAFLALFDGFDDFDSIAHDAVTTGLPPGDQRAASK